MNNMSDIDGTYNTNNIDYNNGIDNMNYMCYTYDTYKGKGVV